MPDAPKIKTVNRAPKTIKTVDRSIKDNRAMRAYTKAKSRIREETQSTNSTPEEYASQQYESRLEEAVTDSVYNFNRLGHQSFEATKENINRHKNKAHSQQKHPNVSIKTTSKNVNNTAKDAQKVAQASKKASQKAAETAKKVSREVAQKVKFLAKATVKAVKSIIEGAKALISVIMAGGWVAVLIIIILCMAALLCSSVFGIFLANEDAESGLTLKSAMNELNNEFNERLQNECNSNYYDSIEIIGERAGFKDVLAVYAVKTNTDINNPQEVATMNNSKKRILKGVFWDMTKISSISEVRYETIITESFDEYGNIIQSEIYVPFTTLFVIIESKTAWEMAELCGFNQEQYEMLYELLRAENDEMWNEILR